MANILLVIASRGYQVKEYGDTKTILENNGHIVVTASDKIDEAVSHIGSKTKVDILVDNVDINDYDGVYLIGGPGALSCLDNERVYRIIRNVSNESNKFFGAICISPRILINSGIMKGIKMTGWNGDNELEDICRKANSIYVRESVVCDGRIITAEGPMSAVKFGETISKQFV